MTGFAKENTKEVYYRDWGYRDDVDEDDDGNDDGDDDGDSNNGHSVGGAKKRARVSRKRTVRGKKARLRRWRRQETVRKLIF